MEAEALQLHTPKLSHPKSLLLNTREEDALCLHQRMKPFTRDIRSMSSCRGGNQSTEGTW